jgi:hypothetical protein
MSKTAYTLTLDQVTNLVNTLAIANLNIDDQIILAFNVLFPNCDKDVLKSINSLGNLIAQQAGKVKLSIDDFVIIGNELKTNPLIGVSLFTSISVEAIMIRDAILASNTKINNMTISNFVFSAIMFALFESIIQSTEGSQQYIINNKLAINQLITIVYSGYISFATTSTGVSHIASWFNSVTCTCCSKSSTTKTPDQINIIASNNAGIVANAIHNH